MDDYPSGFSIKRWHGLYKISCYWLRNLYFMIGNSTGNKWLAKQMILNIPLKLQFHCTFKFRFVSI